MKYFVKTLAVFLLIGPVLAVDFIMDSHGYIGFAAHVHGFNKTNSVNPGYRAEFMAITDIFQIDRLYLGLLVGNRTLIQSSEEVGQFRLDKIKYTLSPNLRYELDDWMVRCVFHHDAFHHISSANLSGPVWLNSVQLSIGTKGAYYLYLHEQYRRVKNQFINAWDAHITGGVFLHGEESIWLAKNHNYKYELFSRFRYHIAAFHNWAYWVGLEYNIWQTRSYEFENRAVLRMNLFRKGLSNFVGIYYLYFLQDSYSLDNEDQLGALGVQIIF